jgi:hypothetical protein
MKHKLPFPVEYIRREGSSISYDLERTVTDPLYSNYILERLPTSSHYVGIIKGEGHRGSNITILATDFHPDSKFSYVKNGQLIGAKPEDKWTLLHDVVETGRSLLEAISLIGSDPENIVVAVDKREKNENPVVNSLFEI